MALPGPYPIEAGSRLAALRRYLGLTKRAVALKGGLNPTEVSLWERGIRKIPGTSRSVIGLARGLGLPRDSIRGYLLGDLDVIEFNLSPTQKRTALPLSWAIALYDLKEAGLQEEYVADVLMKLRNRLLRESEEEETP